MNESERGAVEFLFEMLSEAVSKVVTSKTHHEGKEADSNASEHTLDLVNVIFSSDVLRASFLPDMSHDRGKYDNAKEENRRHKRRKQASPRRSSSDSNVIFTHAIANLMTHVLEHCVQFRSSLDFQYYIKKLTSCAVELTSRSGSMTPKLGVCYTHRLSRVHVYHY